MISHQEAMAAMGEATNAMCNGLVAKFQAAMDAVSLLMSAMSSYYSAQSDYEVTVTEKNMRSSSRRRVTIPLRQKARREKEKEVAKIKTKYARKQAAMQVAQAIAQTAISAIAAYGSAMQGVPYPANMVLAPIAAGIAAAAGAIQIATIKNNSKLKRLAIMRAALRVVEATAERLVSYMRASSWQTITPSTIATSSRLYG